MTVFNSLGSNYNFAFVFRALFAGGDPMQLKNFLATKYQGEAFLVYKGREALRLALRASNLKGATVAICGFTCFAVYDAIIKEGFAVDYLDIEKESLNFSYDTFKRAIERNPKIKIVIIQNTLGNPAKMDRMVEYCKENNIILIEDLAHSIGAQYKAGQEAGTVGDFVVLSFSQDKVVDGISGGALIVRNEKFKMQNFGSFTEIDFTQQVRDRYYPLLTFLIRITYRIWIGKIIHMLFKKLHLLSNPMKESIEIHNLPGWYCSLIYKEFIDLEKNLSHKKKIATLYFEKLQNKALISILMQQIPLATCLRFPIFLEKRENLIAYFKEKHIYVSDIWYDSPIAPKQYLQQTNYNAGQCPNSEAVSSVILNLPTHKNISEKKANKIIEEINLWRDLQ